MARSRQQILDAFLADPQYDTLTDFVNGEAITLTAEQRLARLGDWADATLIQEQEQDAKTARKQLRAQVRAALTRLDQIATATPPFTNAQRDAAIQDMARVQAGLIRVLMDLNLIERTD